MNNDDMKDQVITASYLANILARDSAFVSEIGLDEFQPDEIIRLLEDVIGFILAMYNTTKAIFSSSETLTLDEKLVRLIYSRFVLFPSFSQRTLDQLDSLDPEEALKFAKNCYEDIKRDTDGTKWADTPLSTKFFEVCVRVYIEEDIADFRVDDITMPDIALFTMGTRSVLALVFKSVFSHIKWDLEDKHISPFEKVILTPKKVSGPDSRLKKYPLLYLYFDNFEEISNDWNKLYFEAAMHEGDIRSRGLSLDEIMKNQNLFLELYNNGLIRIKLWDGIVLLRKDEEFYLDRAIHPEKYMDEISHLYDPVIINERKKLLKKISFVVQALKIRYGLAHSDNT